MIRNTYLAFVQFLTELLQPLEFPERTGKVSLVMLMR